MGLTSTETSSLLTVILTTSIVPSAPSTDLISSVLESFASHCPSLLTCRIIVVFDGFDQVTAKARLKRGQVTSEQAQSFDVYKQNVKELVISRFRGCGHDEIVWTQSFAEAEYGSPWDPENAVSYAIHRTQDKQVIFVEASRRLGFGLAVRSALRLTETPYVWIQQHDWSLTVDVPVDHLLHIMTASESDIQAPVKYICLPGPRMMNYATSNEVVPHPALKQLTASLKQRFSVTSQPQANIMLTPLFFWYDKPHMASTAHYFARVFPSRLAMMRGDFIEDKIGQIARNQMKQGQWTKWACWLYCPNDGRTFCVKHLRGRYWRGFESDVFAAAGSRQSSGYYTSIGTNETIGVKNAH